VAHATIMSGMPMRGYQTVFRSGPEDPLTEWINERVRAIRLCLESGLPEPAITLIYSGIDTIGLLDAPADQLDANKDSFIEWSERYIVPSLRAIDGEQVAALDLYSARCGILHVSSPISKLAREGEAREIWYKSSKGTGGHPLALPNRKELPLFVEMEMLEGAFRDGCDRFLSDLTAEQIRFKKVIERAKQLLVWGIGSIMSDADVDAYLAARRTKQ
jgi:hypothetical protein